MNRDIGKYILAFIFIAIGMSDFFMTRFDDPVLAVLLGASAGFILMAILIAVANLINSKKKQ